MATDYQAFIDRLVLFLKGVNVAVQLDHSVPQSASVHPPSMQAGSTARIWVVVLLIALVMVTAAAIVLYLRS
jgi:hypothetical protein